MNSVGLIYEDQNEFLAIFKRDEWLGEIRSEFVPWFTGGFYSKENIS